MSQNLIVDCDGTLLNWRDSFDQWLTNFQVIESGAWKFEDYNLPQLNFNIPVYKLFEMFNQTFHVRNLAPIPGAVSAIEKFHRDGYAIHVISSFSNQFPSIQMRSDNLIDVFGDVFQSITCLPVSARKIDQLKLFPKDSIFVEDQFPHLNDAHKIGFSLDNLNLIPHAYNADKYPGVHRRGWQQITDAYIG